MEKLTIEESYQTILHDLDRLTENVLLLREACVQSKKITMEDVIEFLMEDVVGLPRGYTGDSGGDPSGAEVEPRTDMESPMRMPSPQEDLDPQRERLHWIPLVRLRASNGTVRGAYD